MSQASSSPIPAEAVTADATMAPPPPPGAAPPAEASTPETTRTTTQTTTLSRGGRNEWLLVIFTAATNTADAVTKVALPLLAATLTDSPALVAGVLSALTLPWLVTALHVGVLVDRFNRRSLMVAAEVARMVCMGVLLAAYLGDVLTIPMIYMVAVVLGVAEVVALTSAASIVPSAVPRERWETANARITAMEYLCNGFVGSPVGGWLVGIGFALALTVTAGVYVGGMVFLLMLVGNFAVASAKERRPISAEIREGLGFLWRHRLLRTMALLISVMAGCWAAWLAIMPVYAVGAGPLRLGKEGLGLLLTCLGAGGVLGTMLVGRTNRWLGRRWSMFADIIGSFLLVAIPALVPARPSSAWAVGAAAFLAGVGGTMWTVNSRVVIMSLVPNNMLGRFSAASRLLGWGATPIAAALMGLLAETVGYRLAFATFALLCASLVVPYLWVVTPEALAEVDRQQAEPATA